MRKFKSTLALVLCLVMVCMTLAACGSKRVEFFDEDTSAVPADSYEINWYFFDYAGGQKDKGSVEKEINAYLKDKINATVKLNILDQGTYSDKMNAKMAAGEYYDMCFVANWSLSYKTTAKSGAWLALDDYLDTYLPQTVEQIGMDVMENARCEDGHIYAIPNLKEFAENRGWAYRTDIMEKYNINMEDYVVKGATTEETAANCYKSFDLLRPILDTIRENEPDMQYPLDWDSTRTPTCFLGTEGHGGSATIFEHLYPGKVVDLYQTEEYRGAVSISRKLYTDGYIRKDINTASDFIDRLKEGKTAVYAEFLKPGKTAELTSTYGVPLSQVDVTPITMSNGTGTGSMLAVSATSKNPARVLRFIELLNTDQYLNNLINYGIEGKHYKKINDNTIEVIKGAGYSLSDSRWMMGNVFLNYLTPDESPTKVQELKDFNAKAVKPQQYGFTANMEAFDTVKTGLNTIKSEYQLVLGAEDPLPLIDELEKRLAENGQEEYTAEVQKQFDEFLKNKKAE
jgi:putative aldouronate transport system substrate-binding protein